MTVHADLQETFASLMLIAIVVAGLFGWPRRWFRPKQRIEDAARRVGVGLPYAPECPVTETDHDFPVSSSGKEPCTFCGMQPPVDTEGDAT